ncbi:MAG: metal-dependent hydrolase [Halorhabdus sp.]
MFVGHAFLAFGLATLLARRVQPEDRPSAIPGRIPLSYPVAIGLAAAAFASLPDVDIVHAAFQVVSLPAESTAVDHFWAAATERHRTITHSLVVALLGSGGFALWMVHRWIGWIALSALVLLATVAGGPVGGAVMLTFVILGVVVATIAAAFDVSPRAIFGAAALGLSVHPFTDLLTGQPPEFFAPWAFMPIATRIRPFGDPTTNLLVAFGTELAVIWFGLGVGVVALGVNPRRHVHPEAALGVVYAPMALILDGASVDNAVPFVATILPLGLLGLVSRERPWTITGGITVVLTGLAAITLAWLAFALVYVTGV